VEHNLQINAGSKTRSFSTGQLFLVFVCLAVAFSSSLAILGLEMAYISIMSRYAHLIRDTHPVSEKATTLNSNDFSTEDTQEHKCGIDKVTI
jgi:hypothetical protein